MFTFEALCPSPATDKKPEMAGDPSSMLSKERLRAMKQVRIRLEERLQRVLAMAKSKKSMVLGEHSYSLASSSPLQDEKVENPNTTIGLESSSTSVSVGHNSVAVIFKK